MSEHKQPKNSAGIATSNEIHNSRIFSKKRIIICTLVVVLILVGGLCLLISHHWISSSHTNVNQIDLSNQNNLKNAQSDVVNAKTPQAKSVAYSNLGGDYINDHQYQDAITSYQSSLTAEGVNNISASVGLAYAYYNAGQNKQAISAFQKVITQLQQSNDPYAQSKISGFQEIVQQLQASQGK
jgi:tetratricopeptide (TPR) repeat protein